jgi:nicotinamide riboside transporter PnuC
MGDSKRERERIKQIYLLYFWKKKGEREERERRERISRLIIYIF